MSKSKKILLAVCALVILYIASGYIYQEKKCMDPFGPSNLMIYEHLNPFFPIDFYILWNMDWRMDPNLAGCSV